jgi:Concanavalin A-like lectin/glucanases superfamily
MDYTSIVLVLILIFVIYTGYTYLFMTSIIVNKPIDLKVANTQLTYAAEKLKQPGSTRYYYEAWIFIDYNFPTDGKHIIFNRGTNFILVLEGSRLSIYDGGQAPPNGIYNSTAPRDNNNQRTGPDGIERLVLTTSFPFQKWVQIAISVDGSVTDAYLDGKLVKTITNYRFAINKDVPITAGNIKTIGKLNQFSYWPNTLDPQTVWNKYIQGNGLYGINNYFRQYKVDMSFLKDNEELYNFSLL